MREVVCSTARLDLVVPTMEDCRALATMWGDPETMRYIGDGSGWTREKVEERIKRAIERQQDRGMTFWTVIERSSGEVIGQGGLVPIEFNGDEIELGYRLGKAHWGNGYASEIARASAAYGFEELGFEALVGVCNAENLASRRVLIKAGFVEDGESEVYYGVPTVVHRMRRNSKSQNECVR